MANRGNKITRKVWKRCSQRKIDGEISREEEEEEVLKTN